MRVAAAAWVAESAERVALRDRLRSPPALRCQRATVHCRNVGASRPWNHTESAITSAAGFPNHRGRDLILLPTADQWIIGKFAYGAIDKDIHDEEVNVWLERDCAGSWEELGTELTTTDGQHATVEGVDDTGGRI